MSCGGEWVNAAVAIALAWAVAWFGASVVRAMFNWRAGYITGCREDRT